jgi:hypothetical protein
MLYFFWTFHPSWKHLVNANFMNSYNKICRLPLYSYRSTHHTGWRHRGHCISNSADRSRYHVPFTYFKLAFISMKLTWFVEVFTIPHSSKRFINISQQRKIPFNFMGKWYREHPFCKILLSFLKQFGVLNRRKSVTLVVLTREWYKCLSMATSIDCQIWL